MEIEETLDVSGLTCPMPLLKTKQKLNKLTVGEVVKVIATDPGTQRDFVSYISLSNHVLLEAKVEDGCYIYRIQKG